MFTVGNIYFTMFRVSFRELFGVLVNFIYYFFERIGDEMDSSVHSYISLVKHRCCWYKRFRQFAIQIVLSFSLIDSLVLLRDRGSALCYTHETFPSIDSLRNKHILDATAVIENVLVQPLARIARRPQFFCYIILVKHRCSCSRAFNKTRDSC